MNEQQFYQVLHQKARDLKMNPLLLVSGIEGLYSFRDVPINTINYEYLDCLILTIFALRIGDHFHGIAEQNLGSDNYATKVAAINELAEVSQEEINRSSNAFLQSFAQVLGGKTVIRKYHEKALEVAAMEIQKVQDEFGEKHIGSIMLAICKTQLEGLINFSALFRS